MSDRFQYLIVRKFKTKPSLTIAQNLSLVEKLSKHEGSKHIIRRSSRRIVYNKHHVSEKKKVKFVKNHVNMCQDF